jgi:hypothetical protein
MVESPLAASRAADLAVLRAAVEHGPGGALRDQLSERIQHVEKTGYPVTQEDLNLAVELFPALGE